MSKSPNSERQERIAALVQLLIKDPSHDEIPVGNDPNENLFKEIVNQCQETIQQALALLQGDANKKDSTLRDAFEDELLTCLELLYRVTQRQTKWCSKPRWKQQLHSKRYNAELASFQKQFQGCKTRLLASMSRYKRGAVYEAILPPTELCSHRIVGRDKTMQQIEKGFNNGNTMVSLVGLSGVGKSLCASRFATTWMEEDEFNRTVFWLSAKTEASVRDGYLQVLGRLGAEVDKHSKISTSTLARDTWDKLELLSSVHNMQWLIVFDGVPEVLNGLEGPGAFLPLLFPISAIRESPAQARILFTTRSVAYKGATRLGNISAVTLSPFAVNDAIKLLVPEQYQNINADTKEAARELVQDCGGMPLAIAKMNEHLSNSGKTILDFSERLKSVVMKESIDILEDCLGNVLKHVRTQGLEHLVTAISGPDTNHLALETCGYDKDDMERLRHLGLVQFDEKQKVYIMHPLYKQAVRKYFEEDPKCRKFQVNIAHTTKKAVRFASTIILPSTMNEQQLTNEKAKAHGKQEIRCSTVASRNAAQHGPLRMALFALVLIILPHVASYSACGFLGYLPLRQNTVDLLA